MEAERDALLTPAEDATAPPSLLLGLKGVGSEIAAILWSEGLFRTFNNRRQAGRLCGPGADAWKSGSVDQAGVKAGNPVCAQPSSSWLALAATSTRFGAEPVVPERVKQNGGRLKKPMIVALARKLLIALWKYVTAGVVIEEPP